MHTRQKPPVSWVKADVRDQRSPRVGQANGIGWGQVEAGITVQRWPRVGDASQANGMGYGQVEAVQRSQASKGLGQVKAGITVQRSPRVRDAKQANGTGWGTTGRCHRLPRVWDAVLETHEALKKCNSSKIQHQCRHMTKSLQEKIYGAEKRQMENEGHKIRPLSPCPPTK